MEFLWPLHRNEKWKSIEAIYTRALRWEALKDLESRYGARELELPGFSEALDSDPEMKDLDEEKVKKLRDGYYDQARAQQAKADAAADAAREARAEAAKAKAARAEVVMAEEGPIEHRPQGSDDP